jgi:arylsulfatase A-like enzyme
MRGTDVMDANPAQASLTERFTSQAVNFIDRNKDRPFFLYFAHTAPHIPLAPSERFRGKSGRGAYGDVVAEVDWSVGEVLKALKRNGIDENTLIMFTSDNGPWYQGSAGRLQGRKGSTYEGGMRVPFIARFPGKIPAGSEATALASAMDLLPTIAGLAGASVPAGSVDGVDLWRVLSGELAFIDREVLLFFDGWNIQAARWGPWKLHLARHNSYPWTEDPASGRYNLPLNPPELYHIDEDPTESYDRASENPQVVKELSERVERLLLSLPEQVRVAWQDTRNQRVINMPTGALPRHP